VDANNLILRAVHVVKNAPNHRDWIGRTYMIVFQSMAKMANKFAADHCVACFDSYSWREEIYQTYKENRRQDASPKAIETKKVSHTILREFVEYLRTKTNMTVLEAPRIEADDFIARWVQRHTSTLDAHVIISNDADFKQLVAPGVDLYDPIPGVLYTTDGVYFQDRKNRDHPTVRRYHEEWQIRYAQPKTTLVYRYDWDDHNKGKKGTIQFPVSAYPNGEGFRVGDLTKHDQPIKIIRIIGEQRGWEYRFGMWMRFPMLTEKTPLLLTPENYIRFVQPRETFIPQWELFLKCIRGDARDNIRPSYPRVPETRLRKAFADKTEFVKLINDSFGQSDRRHPVKPLFEMNKKLIDLTAQPHDIITEMDRIINTAIQQPAKQMVEIYFDRFCDDYEIRKLKEAKQNILPIISKPYMRLLL